MSFSVSSTPTQPRVDFTPLPAAYSIENNEGYTITMSEDGNTIHLKDRFGDEIQGLIQIGVQIRQEEIDSADPSAHFECLVKGRIQELAESKDKFGFQVFKDHGPEGERDAIKFGQYGLAGGAGDGEEERLYVGKDGKIYSRLTKHETRVARAYAVGAVVLGTFFFGPPGGAVALGSVYGGKRYLDTTPCFEETPNGLPLAIVKGGVAGGAGAVAATALPTVKAGAVLSKAGAGALTGAVKGVVGGLTHLFVDKALDKGEAPTKKEIATTAAVGGVGGAVGGGIAGHFNGLDAAKVEAGGKAAKRSIQLLRAATAGAGGGGSAKATFNIIEGRPAGEGVLGAAAMGGGLAAMNRFVEELEWANKIRQERAKVNFAKEEWNKQADKESGNLKEEFGKIKIDKVDVQRQFNEIGEHIEKHHGERLNSAVKQYPEWIRAEIREALKWQLAMGHRQNYGSKNHPHFIPKKGPDLSQKDAYWKAVGDKNSLSERIKNYNGDFEKFNNETVPNGNQAIDDMVHDFNEMVRHGYTPKDPGFPSGLTQLLQKSKRPNNSGPNQKSSGKSNASSQSGLQAQNVMTKERARELLAKDYIIHTNPGAGPCLFYAVAHLIDKAPASLERADQLRAQMIKHIKGHRNDFIDTLGVADGDAGNLTRDQIFDRYVEHMSLSKTWGSENELRALSLVLKRRIEVCYPAIMNENAQGELNLLNPHIYGENFEGKPLRLFYNGVDHYEAMEWRPVEPIHIEPIAPINLVEIEEDNDLPQLVNWNVVGGAENGHRVVQEQMAPANGPRAELLGSGIDDRGRREVVVGRANDLGDVRERTEERVRGRLSAFATENPFAALNNPEDDG